MEVLANGAHVEDSALAALVVELDVFGGNRVAVEGGDEGQRRGKGR
jgi:hypothetical protein